MPLALFELLLLVYWISNASNHIIVMRSIFTPQYCILGNSVKTVTKTNTVIGHAEGKAQDAAITKEVAVATTLVDEFLSEIAKCCCITLMPGQHDPTNAMLPQKPLHPCILPLTSRYCTNVHSDIVDIHSDFSMNKIRL